MPIRLLVLTSLGLESASEHRSLTQERFQRYYVGRTSASPMTDEISPPLIPTWEKADPSAGAYRTVSSTVGMGQPHPGLV